MFLNLRALSKLIIILLTFWVSLAISHASAIPPVMWLAIPAIELSEPVYPVGIIDRGDYLTWQVLDNGIGWHNLTAKPGEAGNTVLNGHSEVKGRVFERLERLQVGSTLTLEYAGRRYNYTVKYMVLVQEEGVSLAERYKNAQLIQPTEDERVTLVTCEDGTKYRLIVVGFPE